MASALIISLMQGGYYRSKSLKIELKSKINHQSKSFAKLSALGVSVVKTSQIDKIRHRAQGTQRLHRDFQPPAIVNIITCSRDAYLPLVCFFNVNFFCDTAHQLHNWYKTRAPTLASQSS